MGRHFARRSVRSGGTTADPRLAEAKGAVFENVALWKRARYFPRGGEDCMPPCARMPRGAVRLWIFDASTLGRSKSRGRCSLIHNACINNFQLGVGPIALRNTVAKMAHLSTMASWRAPARRSLPRDHHHGRRAPCPRVMEDYRARPNGRSSGVAALSTTEQLGRHSPVQVRMRAGARDTGGGHRYRFGVPHMSVGRGRICGCRCCCFA